MVVKIKIRDIKMNKLIWLMKTQFFHVIVEERVIDLSFHV